jgi:hypothetical protein
MQNDWKNAIQKIQLMDKIKQSIPVDFDTYEKLHKKEIETPINTNQKGFVLSKIEKEINEVEAIIKPITKAVYGDSDDKFDEDVVKLYQNMAEKEKD